MKNMNKRKVLLGILLLLGIAYVAYIFVGKKDDAEDQDEPPTSPVVVPLLNYSLIRSYPHDTASFTQGLIIHKGQMYEGTGLEGASRLLEVDLPGGKIIRTHKLKDHYFGEGITILNDTLYQLTWQNKVVLVYTLPDLEQVKEFKITTEGWGITTDGTQLIVSDGSSDLYYYEPSDFSLVKRQSITEGGLLSPYLNELEYIDGFIYANKFMSPFILKIDPAKGEVVAKIDVTDLWRRAKTAYANADVPNGIAYDATKKKIYITGKLWPELYEIALSQ